MFASVEYHSKVQIRINDGLGGSILLAEGDDLIAGRQIVDLLNEKFTFTKGLTISSEEGIR